VNKVYKSYGINSKLSATCLSLVTSQEDNYGSGNEAYYSLAPEKNGNSCSSGQGTCNNGACERYDARISAFEIKTSEGNSAIHIHTDTTYTLRVRVLNFGNQPITSTLRFYIGEETPRSSNNLERSYAEQIGNEVSVTLPGKFFSADWFETTWTPKDAQSTKIWAWVDPKDNISEFNETNNLKSKEIIVLQKPTEAKLVLNEEDIILDPSFFIEGKTTELEFTFSNAGETKTADDCDLEITFNDITYTSADYYLDENGYPLKLVGCGNIRGGETVIGHLTLLEPKPEGEINNLTIKLGDHTTKKVSIPTISYIDCESGTCKIDCAKMFCDKTQILLTMLKLNEEGYFPKNEGEKIFVNLWTMPFDGEGDSFIQSFDDVYLSNNMITDSTLAEIIGGSSYRFENYYELESTPTFFCDYEDSSSTCIELNKFFWYAEGGLLTYEIRKARMGTNKKVYSIEVIDNKSSVYIENEDVTKKYPHIYMGLNLPLLYYSTNEEFGPCFYPSEKSSEDLLINTLIWSGEDPLSPQFLNNCDYTKTTNYFYEPKKFSPGPIQIGQNENEISLKYGLANSGFESINLLLEKAQVNDIFAKFYTDISEINSENTSHELLTRIWWTTEGMHIGYNE